MYDISPSVQVNYNIRSDNHIGVYHLPIRCLIFAIILVCVVNITSSIPRCAIILGLTLVMLIHLMIWRNE